jgi:hypothetical protein
MTTSASRSGPGRRLHALDGLRAIMMLLGLVLSGPIRLASHLFLVRGTFVGVVLDGRRYPLRREARQVCATSR